MRLARISFVVIAFLTLACASGFPYSSKQPPIPTGSWRLKSQLQAPGGCCYNEFGQSASVSGATAVIGAEGESNSTGAAYVFSKLQNHPEAYSQAARLSASDGSEGDQFGTSVAISGDTIVVGAPGVRGGQGKAYVFVKPDGGWTDMTETAQLTASNGLPEDVFGISVGIDGDTIATGAQGADSQAGAAYVFVKPNGGWTTMTQSAELTATGRASGDALGTSVAVNGSTVAAGAPGIRHRGGMLLFQEPQAGWKNMTQTAALGAPDRQPIGFAVALSGDILVTGAPDARFGQGPVGAAYLYVKPPVGWRGISFSPNAILRASDGKRMDKFGTSVTVNGNTVLVGAPNAHCVGRNCNGYYTKGKGAVYGYIEPDGGWQNTTETAQLLPQYGIVESQYGQSVAAEGAVVIVGMPGRSAGYYFSYNANLEFTGFNADNSKYTYANGVNNLGQIVGDYETNDGYFFGFVDANGDFATVAYPSAVSTSATGINDAGDVVGSYEIGANTFGFVEQNGSYTSIAYPGAQYTYVTGINNSNDIVGFFVDANGANHGFVYSQGVFTEIDPPGADSSDLVGVNDSGWLLGGACIEKYCFAFVYENGAFSRVKYPGSTHTFAGGINNEGDIVGSWYVGNGLSQAFAYSKMGHKFMSFELGSGSTSAYGVNDSGEVVGSFVTLQGDFGFYGSPRPNLSRRSIEFSH